MADSMKQRRHNKGWGIDATGRSKHGDRHVRLHYWLLNSLAYKSLSVCARALLVEFYQRYNGGNNGDIALSVRYAANQLNVAPGTALKAIRQLEDRGFICVKQRGAFEWKAHHATTWILTEFEYWGQLPTKDFIRWGQKESPLVQPRLGVSKLTDTVKIQKPVSLYDTHGIKS